MPAKWAVNEDTWERAKAAATKQGHGEDYGYIKHIYKQIGGKIEGSMQKSRVFLLCKSKDDKDLDLTYRKLFRHYKHREARRKNYGDILTTKGQD